MNLENLINRHYSAQEKRGTINENTVHADFIEKEHEEDVEALMELPEFKQGKPNNYIQERIDMIAVSINEIKWLGYDFAKEYEKNVIRQETRED